MTMLECRVGLLQDLFSGNCVGLVKGEKAQKPHGGAAGIEPLNLRTLHFVSHYAMRTPLL